MVPFLGSNAGNFDALTIGVSLILIYVIARLVFAAYFREKGEYTLKMMKDVQKACNKENQVG